MGVSKNRGGPRKLSIFRVFHYKPSILGYPYFWKHRYLPTLTIKKQLNARNYTIRYSESYGNMNFICTLIYLSKANAWWLEASHEMDESSNIFPVDLPKKKQEDLAKLITGIFGLERWRMERSKELPTDSA